MTSLYFVAIIFGTALIWFSGKRLVQIVDTISEKTGAGKAFLGSVLLGTLTSLPEISTTMIAASLGNAQLAASNLIGGISMQTSMLAVADFFLLKGALTFMTPNSALLMSAIFLIIQISYIISCVAAGEIFQVFQIGLFASGSFILYILCLYLLRRYEKEKRWVPVDYPDVPKKEKNASVHRMLENQSLKSIYIRLILYGSLVFIGGSVVSYSAHRITELTLLSSSFLGATFVAFATSIPELSTTLASIQQGFYTLAIANIFGSNLLMVGLIFFADIFFRKGPLIDFVDNSTLFLAGLGILVTAVYLWGLLERRDRTIFRMGIDSFLVLLIHITGLVILCCWF